MPRSLFGRTLLVLAVGLTLQQLGSIAIHLFDRGSSVYRLASMQITARIGQTARILNRLPPQERQKVVDEIRGRNLRVALEVSGVGRGGIASRLREKLEQVANSPDVDQRWAGVVGFEEPAVALHSTGGDRGR